MSVKQLLKASKAAIERMDTEDAIYYADEVISTDKNNYLAHVFKGKAYQLQAQLAPAEKMFAKAIQIDPENLLAWRGYYQVVRASDDFSNFFRVLTLYLAKLSEQGVALAEPIKEAYNYLHEHKFQSNPQLNELYLRNLLPGSELAAIVGDSMGKPQDNIKKYLEITKAKEDKEVRDVVSKEKLKMPRTLTPELKLRLYQMEWSVRLKYHLTLLYQLLIDYCTDDDARRKYELDLMHYKYDLLKIVPDKDQLLAEVKQMAEDFVFLDTDDSSIWSWNFDFQDPRSLSDLNVDQVLRFIRKFKTEGLGLVLYLYVKSDLCSFDKNLIQNVLQETSSSAAAEDNDADLEQALETTAMLADVENEESEDLSSADLLAIMMDGYSKCSNSMLAHRIICNYYLYLQEYDIASQKCAVVISSLADLQRTYGIELVNCKADILCLLAVLYTYHEAPKNYGRALHLYDSILKTDPKNRRAIIGKGLILVARRQLSEAKKILSEVIEIYPHDATALSEFGWCQVLESAHSEGRASLQAALTNVVGASLKSFETRATIRWRIAKSYMVEVESNTDYLTKAYDSLILALKDSKYYAPAYTLLGVIYWDHYDDKARAQKCFYKAFELDLGEILAAKYLVKDLAKNKDWDVCDILCKRVVSTEKSKRALFDKHSEDDDRAWPYRVLGCSALNRQDDAKAVEWFQTALRMHAMDFQCWLGLGEAYFNCGRVDAAIKVFQHTSEMDPDSWISKYMLGRAIGTTGDYDSAIDVLKEALSKSPNSECILNAIFEQSILSSSQLLMGGFVKRAIAVNRSAIETIAESVKINSGSMSLWKSLADCLQFVCAVQQDAEKFPVSLVVSIFENAGDVNDEDASLQIAQELFVERSFAEAMCIFEILAARTAISCCGLKSSKYMRSYTHYNLGNALLNAFTVFEEKNTVFRDKAIEAYKKAITIEPENALYWLALGNSYVSCDPMLSQHCYIKASVYDPKDVNAWSNLAFLYLKYGDGELAQEAFNRATSIAPDGAIPWLGNALTAEVMGDDMTARKFSTHALILSNGASPLAQLCYAISIVNARIGVSNDSRDIEAAQEVSIANFAIQSFLKRDPRNQIGLKLALLLSERCQTFFLSVEIGERLCAVLEEEFESTENTSVLVDFANAKTTLARTYLGVKDYKSSIEHAQVALDLLSEEEVTQPVEKACLSSRIVIGLSFFFNGQYEEALEELQIILNEHSQSQRAVTLVAQVLRALNTTESKQAAIDQLFAFIEENGSSLLVVLTLGAISVADNHEEYFAAIKEELEGLSTGELSADSFRLVPKLLQELTARITQPGDSKIWQRYALLFSGDMLVWKNLSNRMALLSGLLSESKQTASEMSDAYLQCASRREIQRALLVCADNEHARRVFQRSVRSSPV